MNCIYKVPCFAFGTESDRERFESRAPTSPARNQVQLPRGIENTFTRGRYTPSGIIYLRKFCVKKMTIMLNDCNSKTFFHFVESSSTTRGPVSPTRSQVSLPRGFENIASPRPSSGLFSYELRLYKVFTYSALTYMCSRGSEYN
jgi:hypothetical protein